MSEKIINQFPDTESWNQVFEKNAVIIFAAGFEQRCGALIENAPCKKEKIIKSFLIIKYLPEINKNELRLQELLKQLKEKGYSNKDIQYITFDRIQPHLFGNELNGYFEKHQNKKNIIYWDLSGMSKLLILILQRHFIDKDYPSIAIYAEAKGYHPKKKQFDKFFNKILPIKDRPEFLCRGVKRNIILPEFSGFLNISFPYLLVAFLGFNYKLISSLFGNLYFEKIVQISPIPKDKRLSWRVKANFEIHSGIINTSEHKYELSAFDYKSTLKKLQNIFNEYKYTHNFVVAPLGSKLQTIGVGLFQFIHSEIQIIYPVPDKFSVDEYSDGVKEFFQIKLKDTGKIKALSNEIKNSIIDQL